MLDAAVWSLSRIGGRKLFNGPINLVVGASVVTRWIDALLRLPPTPSLLEALVQMAQITGDAARVVSPAVLENVRRACETSPSSAALLRQLAGETDPAFSSRVFGEELPAGLILSQTHA